MAPASSAPHDPQDPTEAGAPDVPAPPPAPPARYRITAPGPVSGGVHGVAFANGHGVITDSSRHARALAWFRAEPGYHVEAIDPPQPDPPAEPDVDPEPAPEPDPEPAEPDAEEPLPAARRRNR